MSVSHECRQGAHGSCRGFYKGTFPCRCSCHEAVYQDACTHEKEEVHGWVVSCTGCLKTLRWYKRTVLPHGWWGATRKAIRE